MEVTQSLTEPYGPSALSGAGNWFEGALLGSVAISIAVIAVAVAGLLLLSGRLDLRRGASVVVGASILFGAAQIAAGLTGLNSAPTAVATPVINPVRAASRTLPPAKPYDPYAGASFTPSR
jgi:type IV secretion system protein VirB2